VTRVPEEENNQTEEQAPEETPAEEPAAEQAPAEEPAAEEPAADEPAADEAAAAEEPAAEEVPAAEEPAPEEAPAEVEAEPEPGEQPSPRQRRRLARSQHTGEAGPQRSPEERAAERNELRRQRAARRRRYRVRSRERRKSSATSTDPQPPVEHAKGKPRVRQGVVVSDKADKTITVRIDMQRPHMTYGKIVRTSSTLHAHDEKNEANAGDTVRVVESRPLSATKRWRLVEILERAR
jgi:small subunit ribosomal protein S17